MSNDTASSFWKSLPSRQHPLELILGESLERYQASATVIACFAPLMTNDRLKIFSFMTGHAP